MCTVIENKAKIIIPWNTPQFVAEVYEGKISTYFCILKRYVLKVQAQVFKEIGRHQV
jgi:hypothetical protein